MAQETQEKIIQKMKTALSASAVEVIDDSWKHAGHAAAGVSEQFEGVSLLNRNRMVFDALKEEMQSEIHALVIKAKTPQEVESEGP